MTNRHMQSHAQKMVLLTKQVRGFFDRGEKVRMFHGTTTTTRNDDRDTRRLVDISNLNTIIEINTTDKYVVVEPNVAMDVLVDALMAKGFAPPVVPEFAAITVGGAVQGGAGESSSFRYGCVHNVCLEYEIILADGSVVAASGSQNAKLFHSIACSYGSIGVISLVKMRIVPAKPYVDLTYHPVRDYQQAVQLIAAQSKSGVDVDAIMFSKTHGVVMTGVFAPAKQPAHATFHKASDDWFYLHAQRWSSSDAPHNETIPTRDYFFRYDRGLFWAARFGFRMFHIPFNRLTRFVLAGLFKTRTLYPFLAGAKLSQSFVVQDICLPQKSVVAFMDYNEATLDIFPLWLCPLRPDRRAFLSPTYLQTSLVINVGIWGKFDAGYEQFVVANRDLEAIVARLGGRKVLYAHAYYTKSEFWKIYDHNRYNAVRRDHSSAKILPSIYDKTHVAERYQPSVLKGLLAMIRASGR